MDADKKDEGFPGDLLGIAAADRLRGVMDRLLARFEEAPPAAIFVAGDLTSKGDLPGYEEAAKYLVHTLGIGVRRDPETFFISIGNHDIDRTSVPHDSVDLSLKFQTIRKLWEGFGVKVAAETGIERKLEADGAGAQQACGIAVYSLNSCWGCGEWRHVPDFLRAQVEAASGAGSHSIFADAWREAAWEQLDTPAFRETDLTAAATSITALPSHFLPIISAHHNLLPQPQPRIAMYTEMLNGGLARTRLASLDRTVLYLHGHIHADALERVHQEYPGRGELVAVSAPLVIDGFNEIRCDFSPRTLPVGVEVVRHRVQQHGGVDCGVPTRVPVPYDATLLSTPARSLLAQMASDKSYTFEDARLLMPKRTTVATAVDAILEAEWASAISIRNQRHGRVNWLITKVTP